MATLVLTGHPIIGGDLIGTSLSLSEWLQDDWAILFSHPDDFIPSELELDRWVALARPAFAGACVRPLALARPRRPLDCGWITQLTGDARTVLLRDGSGGYFDAPDDLARRLRDAIAQMDQRFVMLIDGSLKRRKTYAYQTLEHLPSPLDFVRWASTLRNLPEPQEPPVDTHPGYLAQRPRRDWRDGRSPGAFRSQSGA